MATSGPCEITHHGKLDFAECLRLCQVFLSGHSATQYFAECRTRQNKALSKGGFAECQALGKA